MKWLRLGSVALLSLAFVACDDIETLTDLDVTNQNNPDRERALAEAGDIESLIGGAFQIWWDETNWGDGEPGWALSTTGEEGTMSWGNYGMQQLASEPREAWPNSSSWRYASHSEDGWYGAYAALSSVYDGLVALATDPDLSGAFDAVRATAFGKLVQGLSHGLLAQFYDSAFVFNESVDIVTDVLELQAYPAVAAEAVANLEAAIATASGASFELPASWINGRPLTGPELVEYAHAQLARMIPRFARDPAERAAVDWASVIAHVDAGIKQDFMIQGDANVLWQHYGVKWGNQTTNETWSRADYKTIGLYDRTGAYDTWLATFFEDRDDFVMISDDARVTDPTGDGTVGGTDFRYGGESVHRVARGTEHHSSYAYERYADFVNGGESALFPHIKYDVQQLQKAEGLLRMGDKQGAVDIINVTRVGRGGLPPADAGASEAELMEMLNYERRIENFAICMGCAFFDRRGLGPIVPTGPNHHDGPIEGTPLHFAVPGLELEILQKKLYTFGGPGSEGTALGLGAVGAAGFEPQERGAGTMVPASIVYRSLEQRRGDESPLGGAAASLTRYH